MPSRMSFSEVSSSVAPETVHHGLEDVEARGENIFSSLHHARVARDVLGASRPPACRATVRRVARSSTRWCTTSRS